MCLGRSHTHLPLTYFNYTLNKLLTYAAELRLRRKRETEVIEGVCTPAYRKGDLGHSDWGGGGLRGFI
jgi:hypothetical protein